MHTPLRLLVTALLVPAAAYTQEIAVNEVRTLSGPRVGAGWVSGVSSDAHERSFGLRPFASQFGWQFEQLVLPRQGAVSLVVKYAVMVAGIEQGAIFPSLTATIGIRHPAGPEFGVGPGVSPYGAGLAWSAGWNIRYGDVTLPLTVTAMRNGGATLVSLTGGFAIETLRRAGARTRRR